MQFTWRQLGPTCPLAQGCSRQAKLMVPPSREAPACAPCTAGKRSAPHAKGCWHLLPPRWSTGKSQTAHAQGAWKNTHFLDEKGEQKPCQSGKHIDAGLLGCKAGGGAAQAVPSPQSPPPAPRSPLLSPCCKPRCTDSACLHLVLPRSPPTRGAPPTSPPLPGFPPPGLPQSLRGHSRGCWVLARPPGAHTA